MYQKLLLNKQGGIIDVTQQIEQDNCAVICIGLGGTGVDCLKNLKAKIYNRIRPDDPESPVPHYDHIKFLAVDADEKSLEPDKDSPLGDFCRIDYDTEFHRMSYSGSVSSMFDAQKANLDSNPAYREWIEHTKIRILNADAGAGGTRQLGRYLFIRNAREFRDRIVSLIGQARANLNQPKLYIHIFSGVSGGTGAGTFLDACYLVRNAIDQSAATNSYICGYFFLPDVNIAKGLDRETEQYVKDNGFAALQELDYCMNFERNGDKWSQYYEGIGLIETKSPPVALCHLVSANNAEGNELADGYNYSLNVVTDYVIDFLGKTNGFDLASHISNYVQKKARVTKEHGANFEYCIIGASAATLPFKEVLTYLASSVFDNMSSALREKTPTKNDCLEFVNKNALSYDRIYSLLISGADLTAFPLNDVSWKDARANDDLTVTYFSDMQARSSGKVDENYSVLSREIKNYTDSLEGKQNAARSLITKIFIALKDKASDPNCGPFFAAKLLKSNTGVDLVATVEGYIKEAQDKLNQEQAQEDKLYREWKKSQDEFFGKANGMKYKTYANATRQLYVHRAREAAMSRMLDLMKTLRDQLVKLSTDFMDILTSTVRQLMDTFDENKRYLEGGVAPHLSYEEPIATLSDVMPDLERTIQAMDMNANISRFMKELTSESGIKAWIGGSEDDIASFINHYFTSLFQEYSQKTMTSYLQAKYGVVAPAALTDRIQKELMNDLILKASPMFWATNTYDVNQASKIGYITCPAESVEVTAAANNIHQLRKDEFESRIGAVSDRISVMRCFVGVPMYGYQGALRYENDSVNSRVVGQHIFEGKTYHVDGKEVTGRDWRFLPSITPLIIMTANTNSAVLKKNSEAAKSLYLEAVDKNIIRPVNDLNYGIFTIDDAFMGEFRKVYEEGSKKTQDEDRFEAQKKLLSMKENISYDAPIDIPNDCTIAEDEKMQLVRIDHFIMSPKLQDIVSKEIDKINEMEKDIAALKPEENPVLDKYELIMFTGVIPFTPPYISCEDDFGESYALSNPSMAHAAVPLYQVFLSYSDLAEDMQEQLFGKASEKSQSSVKEDYDDITAACTTIWNELKDVKTFVKDAYQEFPDEVEDLKKFLSKMQKDLTVFARKYRIKLT